MTFIPADIERFSKQMLQYSLSSIRNRKSGKVAVKFHMHSESYRTVSVDDMSWQVYKVLTLIKLNVLDSAFFQYTKIVTPVTQFVY